MPLRTLKSKGDSIAFVDRVKLGTVVDARNGHHILSPAKGQSCTTFFDSSTTMSVK
jgi:hypothetical protein